MTEVIVVLADGKPFATPAVGTIVARINHAIRDALFRPHLSHQLQFVIPCLDARDDLVKTERDLLKIIVMFDLKVPQQRLY